MLHTIDIEKGKSVKVFFRSNPETIEMATMAKALVFPTNKADGFSFYQIETAQLMIQDFMKYLGWGQVNLRCHG